MGYFESSPLPTRGSACLLYADRFLFTGDHLAWSIPSQRFTAFRSVCWYDWAEQTESMRRLATYPFEYVLPGHGAPRSLPADEMRAAMRDCVSRMEAA